MADESKKQIAQEQQEKDDFNLTFKTAHGQRTLERMKKFALYDTPSASPHFDTNQTFFNDGTKAVITFIFKVQNRDMNKRRKLYESL